MTKTLRDGRVVLDPRIDRIPRHDDASRMYAAVDRLDVGVPRTSKLLRPGPLALNQRREGGCGGWSAALGLNASPMRHKPPLTDADAQSLYYEAQQNDPYPGGEYPGASPAGQGGTDLISVAKAMQRRGLISSYYWAFGIDDLVRVLRSGYGAQLGIPWYASQYETEPSGKVVVDPTSELVGYHAIWALCFRYAPIPGYTRRRVEHVVWQNSWGEVDYGVEWYGLGGHGFVLVEDLEPLLRKEVWGEAMVPVQAP
jgi:hypothetical protein